MTQIADIDEYNSGMRKSILDKMWWIDKVGDGVKKVFDYGCADGALLQAVHSIDPELELLGYDFNEDMIQLAKQNVPSGKFMTDFYTLSNGIAKCDAVLVASSVFHEIHNYSANIEEEYKCIFHSGYKYIAIRDMFVSEKQYVCSDELSVAKIYQKMPTEMIEEFECFNGALSRNENLLQFLLKYRYKTNWEREVREDYFPQTLEQFLNQIPDVYEIVHFEHYTLPFVRGKVMRDLGIDLKDNTHAKILLRHKG